MLHPPHYDPLQPRIPRGHEGGGRWTREGDHTVRTAAATRVALAPWLHRWRHL